MYRSYVDDYKKLSNEDYFKFKLNDEQSISSSKSVKKSQMNDLKKNLQENKQKQIGNERSEETESDLYSDGIERLHKSVKKPGKNEETDSNIERKVGKWTEQEDEILKELVPLYGGKNWKKIAEHIRGRTPIQCLHRWTKILQPGLVKGPWSIQEDRKLIEWVKKEGPTRWSQCAEVIKGRNGKQCRERWFNSLNPQVKKGNWNAEEDFKLFFFYKKFGGKWAKTALFFEGRTENSLKNRFYSTLRRIASEKRRENSSFENLFNPTNIADKLKSESSGDNQDNSVINDGTLGSYVGLDELKKFISVAEEVVKYQFMKKKEFSHEDIEKYEAKLLESINKTPKSFIKSFKVEKCESEVDKEVKSTKINSTSQNSNQSSNIKNSTINLNVNFNNNSNMNYIINNPQNIGNLSNLNNNLNNLNNLHNSSIFDNSFSNNNNNFSNSNFNIYKNMDIYSLEKDIVDMCDGSLFFPEVHKFSLDTQIDNFLDNIFSSNNIILNNDPLQDCNICVDKPMENETSNENLLKILDNPIIKQVPIQADKTTAHGNLDDGFKLPVVSKNVNSNVINNKEVWKLKCENGKNKNDVFHNLLSQLNGLEKLVKSAKKELSKYEKNENLDDGMNLYGNYTIDNLFKL